MAIPELRAREEAILQVNKHLRQAIARLKAAMDGNRHAIPEAQSEIERALTVMERIPGGS